MLSRFGAVAAALLLAFAVSARAQEGFSMVSVANNTLHYLAPVTPTAETSDSTDDGVPYTQTLYSSVGGGVMVMGSYSIYHATDIRLDPDLVATGFIKGLKAERTNTTPMPYYRGANDVMAGTLVSAKTDLTVCRIRIATDQTQIFAVAACAMPGSGTDSSVLDRIVASFQVTKP